ncbi:hypothetical protein QOT17_022510 [Balamuthia mandrillaris]
MTTPAQPLPPWEDLPVELWSRILWDFDLFYWAPVAAQVCRLWREIIEFNDGPSGVRGPTFLSTVVESPSPAAMHWALGFPQMKRKLLKKYGDDHRVPPGELLIKLVDVDRAEVLEELCATTLPEWGWWSYGCKCVYCYKYGKSFGGFSWDICKWEPEVQYNPYVTPVRMLSRAASRGSLGVVQWFFHRVVPVCTDESKWTEHYLREVRRCAKYYGHPGVREWASRRISLLAASLMPHAMIENGRTQELAMDLRARVAASSGGMLFSEKTPAST